MRRSGGSERERRSSGPRCRPEPPGWPAPSTRAAATGTAISADLPYDPRPLILAGSSRLLARRPQEALDYYRRAFATGERAEIDLNVGRAYGMTGDEEKASAAVLRALWISPTLAASLPKGAAAELTKRIRALEADLYAGRLPAPPPAPD